LHEQHRTQAQSRGLQTEPRGGHQAARPPSPIVQEPAEQREGADRLVGDLLGGSLFEDVPDADHQRGSEREQCRDARPAHEDLLCDRST